MRTRGERRILPIDRDLSVDVVDEPPLSIEDQQRRWLIRRFLRTFDRGDEPTIDALVQEFVAADYRGHFAGEELRGRDALREFLVAMHEAFRWACHTVRDESVEGEWVRVRGLLRGALRRADRDVVWPVAYGHRIVGGRIVEGWHEGRPVGEVLRYLAVSHP